MEHQRPPQLLIDFAFNFGLLGPHHHPLTWTIPKWFPGPRPKPIVLFWSQPYSTRHEAEYLALARVLLRGQTIFVFDHWDWSLLVSSSWKFIDWSLQDIVSQTKFHTNWMQFACFHCCPRVAGQETYSRIDWSVARFPFHCLEAPCFVSTISQASSPI